MITATDHPHHPNFVSAAPGDDGDVVYVFQPFDGSETEPEYDWDQASQLDETARRAYLDEFAAAWREWKIARFGKEFAAAAAKAAPAWDAYRRARQNMDTRFEEVKTSNASRWPAQIASLLDAHDNAVAAATKWDSTASDLAYLYYQLACSVGKNRAPHWYQVVKDVPDGWHTASYVSADRHFYYGTPLTRSLEETVEDQKRRIREISALAFGVSPA